MLFLVFIGSVLELFYRKQSYEHVKLIYSMLLFDLCEAKFYSQIFVLKSSVDVYLKEKPPRDKSLRGLKCDKWVCLFFFG